MKKKGKNRKKLLAGRSNLEVFVKQFYIDRYSNVSNGWGLESKIRWGLPSEQSTPTITMVTPSPIEIVSPAKEL